ncbi:histidine phosphatase family protein [Streptomyces sp. Go40/10]|uniref:SixA phosphatase family protein n=1 Tax=Streptomyces sp. Go40/10 TaxID=2825844 RepID=UPI001E340E3F|nr:histidine phosphatase family protein [Streptomyces sp. Go40/10]UFQ99913.1 histidine phosphatase family protein [Streptomyces sp. Go40/10]
MSDYVSRRHLVLLRSAMAEPSGEGDRERQLAHRGRQDATRAGRWLAGAGITPDAALCSPATRARDTWGLAAPELARRPRTTHDERLYNAEPEELFTVLREIPDDVGNALLIGHNPGTHALADALTGEAAGDLLARMNRSGFPPGAIAVLTFYGSWDNIERGRSSLDAFWHPQPT